MGLKEADPSLVKDPRERILIYSVAGGGKTRLATSLTERFGEIVYVAIDEGSESLDSVLPKYRDRIHVVVPDGVNPLEDAAAIIHTNWRAKYPNAKTIVIDTFSTWTWNVLQYITNAGMFSTKRVVIGEGTQQATALPDVGEYGGVHAQIRLFLTNLFNAQRDMHIIMIFHSDPPEAGRGKGGPSTVGKKMTEWIPARFKTVIRLDREVSNMVQGGSVVQRAQFVALSSPHGEWIARINEASPTGNPMPSVPLSIDPVNFWKRYDDLKIGPAAASLLPKTS